MDSERGCGVGCITMLLIFAIPIALSFVPGGKNVWGLPLPSWYIANSSVLLLLCVVISFAITPLMAAVNVWTWHDESDYGGAVLRGCSALLVGGVLPVAITVGVMLLIPGARDLWGLPFPAWYVERSAAIMLLLYLTFGFLIVTLVGTFVRRIVGYGCLTI